MKVPYPRKSSSTKRETRHRGCSVSSTCFTYSSHSTATCMDKSKNHLSLSNQKARKTVFPSVSFGAGSRIMAPSCYSTSKLSLLDTRAHGLYYLLGGSHSETRAFVRSVASLQLIVDQSSIRTLRARTTFLRNSSSSTTTTISPSATLETDTNSHQPSLNGSQSRSAMMEKIASLAD